MNGEDGMPEMPLLLENQNPIIQGRKANGYTNKKTQ